MSGAPGYRAWGMDGVGTLLWTMLLVALSALPLAISLWALLDITRRPSWAWALSGRRQVVWLAAVLLGFLTVLGGLAVSGWYLWRVRPDIAAAEAGRIT